MFDVTKPFKTRDGRDVTILSIEARGDYPIIGHVGEDSCLRTWTKEGRYNNILKSPVDLVNLPERRKLWVNVYPRPERDCTHKTKHAANKHKGPDCIGQIELEYEVSNDIK